MVLHYLEPRPGGRLQRLQLRRRAQPAGAAGCTFAALAAYNSRHAAGACGPHGTLFPSLPRGSAGTCRRL